VQHVRKSIPSPVHRTIVDRAHLPSHKLL
jgi:hypothetical protein